MTTTTRNRTRQPKNASRRRERPKADRRTSIAIALVVLLALISIPAIGYYSVFVAPMREAVVRVNNTVFDMGYYLERLRIRAIESKKRGGTLDLGVEPFALLENIRNEELIRQSAPAFGLDVTEEQVDRRIRAELQPPRQETEQTSQDELDRQFRDIYRRHLTEFSLSDQDYRKMVRSSVMRDMMKDRLSDRVPAVTEQLRLRVIVVPDEGEVAKVQKRLADGADFATVVRELSKHEETRLQGGEFGWLPRRVVDHPFDDYVFKLEPGAISEPFMLQAQRSDQKDAIWFVQVTERSPARQVEPKAREQLKERALNDWLDEQLDSNVVERFFNSDRYQFVVQKVMEFNARVPQSQQTPVAKSG